MSFYIGRRTRLVAVAFSVSALFMVQNVVASELYGTLKKINDSNKITVGHRDASVPFSYYDANKQAVGYAIDLCKKVAEEVKLVLKKPELQVSYALVNAQTRIPMVADNTVDIECGSTTNTLSRQNQVDFSSVYFTTGTRLLAFKGAGIKEIEDLRGKSVGVVTGSTNEKAIKSMIESGALRSVTLVGFKDYGEGMAAFEKKAIESFATDDIVLYALASKSPVKADVEVVGPFLTYDPYGIMMRRDDSAFRLVVNSALANVFRSGEIQKIYAKWFDPLGVPVSPLMKAAFALQAFPE